MVLKQKSCMRCLVMGKPLEGKRDQWWPSHDSYCKNTFVCEVDNCKNLPREKQRHLVACSSHFKQNKSREPDFIKKLHTKELPKGCSLQNLRFFHIQSYQCTGGQLSVTAPLCKDHLGYRLLPDVREQAVFMLQVVPSEDPSMPLLVFYDSGCSAAVLSDRAHYSLQTVEVTKGPTAIDVAGGKTLMVPHGDERFHLQVEDCDRVKATITGLRMPHVTTAFPVMKLMEAWQDACDHARANEPFLTLPNLSLIHI